MKQTFKTIALILITGLTITSCKKDIKDTSSNSEIAESTLSKIKAHGFGTSDVQKIDEGYLVEGDIILTDEYLNSAPSGNLLRIANNEQYHTTNLVTGLPRNITISASKSISKNLSDGINGAIARYNAENLQITMSRVNAGGNIKISLVTFATYIASAGFPSGGNPYNQVNYNKAYQNYSVDFITTVMAHEIGHCIGFRHTDYMDRSYSCGGSPSNEGASTVGAILVPGTPSGPDAASWMLACLSATTNRPFNANDKVALNHLY